MTWMGRERMSHTQHPISNPPQTPRIIKVLAVPAAGAGYIQDLAALRANPVPLPRRFTATPQTLGFRTVREAAQVVSVGLALDSGQVAWGDCVSGASPGQAGCAPVFRATEGLDAIQRLVAPALEGRELSTFRDLATKVDTLGRAVEPSPPPEEPKVEDPALRAFLTALPRAIQATRHPGSYSPGAQSPTPQLHPALRYGLTQALLQAVALARGVTMAAVIAAEWHLPERRSPIPIHAQCGHERYFDAEKMIVRGVASLPHAAVDDIAEQVGEEGRELLHYARWLKTRIEELGSDGYWPTVHFDVQGALGAIAGDNLGRVLGHLYALELAVQPYPLRVEDPVLLESRDAQIEAMRTLRQYARFRNMKVGLVADGWANTLDDVRAFVDAGAADMIQLKMPDLGGVHHAVEAVLACRAGQVGALLGGSATETGLAARAAAHVALATGPHLVVARPGLGVDEAFSLTHNEMARALAEMQAMKSEE
jgi:methylaspartate ammonia-lyase